MYKDVHVEGARNLARAAKAAGVERFIHVSALGADVDSASGYLASKVFYLFRLFRIAAASPLSIPFPDLHQSTVDRPDQLTNVRLAGFGAGRP